MARSLHPRKITFSDLFEAQAVEMAKRGLSAACIAERTGMTIHSVRRRLWLGATRITDYRNGLTVEAKEAIAAAKEEAPDVQAQLARTADRVRKEHREEMARKKKAGSSKVVKLRKAA